MRNAMLLIALAVELSVLLAASVVAQDSATPGLLPDPSEFGSGWSLLSDPRHETGAQEVVKRASVAEYVGPRGSRIIVLVLVVAEGPKAARDAWERANEFYDDVRFEFDSSYGRERDLEAMPLLDGCADMRRLDGTDELLTDIPVGITLCAADPDLIAFAYVSGEVNGLGGHAASDHVVRLVLARSHFAAATPVAMRPAPTSLGPETNESLLTPTAMPSLDSNVFEGCTVAGGYPAEPDRDISVQTLPLPELLPTQNQVPAGLVLVDEAERSKEEVIAALGGTEEAAQLLDDWGWSGNAFRDFIAENSSTAADGVTFLNVSVHRFADAESAAKALIFWSDQVIFVQGLEEVEPPAVGESARLLKGAPDGVPLTVLYAQQGPIMYRVGGSTESPDGDPTADVLSVAKCIVPERSLATPVSLSSTPAAEANGLAAGAKVAEIENRNGGADHDGVLGLTVEAPSLVNKRFYL